MITISSFPRAIAHVDCDAFFTSVEQALKPELRGKPVVTGKERGIVACASYEAKALGIRRPMVLWEARKMYPGLICVPSDYEAYSLFSKRMFDILRRFTPIVEEYSIDEAFCELTGLRRVFRKNYAAIAWDMKKTIQKELGITVSVGVSLSKTLAKIASKEDKPDGFVVVKGRHLHEFLATMDLDRVCGFGPNTQSLLKKKGIRHVSDYVMRPKIWAHSLLGKVGVELWQELRGEATYGFETKPKDDYISVSKTKTFTPPSKDPDFVRAQLLRNMESGLIKLRRHRLRSGRISIFLRDQEFKSRGVEADLERATRSPLEIAGMVTELFHKVFEPKTLYRLTGIVFSKMESDNGEIQYSLFDNVNRFKAMRRIDHVIDGVNELYGKHTLHLGTTLWLGKHRQHISARGDLPERKSELLRGENYRQRLHLPMWQVKI